MQVTFTLKDLTKAFYQGNGDSITGLLNVSDMDKFQYLNRLAMGDLKHCIKMKIGSGQFRDKVDLNSMLRGAVQTTFKLEPRKGYKLATFEITKG